MSDPIRFLNADGEERWQPNAGEQQLWNTDIGRQWQGSLNTYGRYGPVLYRSYKRAKRIGDRRQRYLERSVFWQASE